MKRFDRGEADAAITCAAEGGQGLHVYPRLAMNAPSCFKHSQFWAHLYDQDTGRLRRTVRSLGVRTVVIHHSGSRQQHVDLCGKPLERAIERCNADRMTVVAKGRRAFWARFDGVEAEVHILGNPNMSTKTKDAMVALVDAIKLYYLHTQQDAAEGPVQPPTASGGRS